MTANAFEEDRRQALQSGMNDFLTKPIHVEKLLTALTAAISI
jgi:CheY-like chemotaxis protein